MPRNKGHRSGTPDGYAPSPLGDPSHAGTPSRGRATARSPLSGMGTPRSRDGGGADDNDAPPSPPPPPPPPVPSWSGLGRWMPGEEAWGAVLEDAPVAAGIGANVHALLSPKLMVAAALGAGDWVALAVVQGPAACGGGHLQAEGEGGSTPSSGGGGGTPASATRGANTPEPPRTPSSRGVSGGSSVGGGGGGGGDAFGSPARASGAFALDRAPALDAPVTLLPALLARNVSLDALPGDAVGAGNFCTPAAAEAAAAESAAGALGRYVVLAQVYPNPRAGSAHGVSLARKVWMSLGSPPGGAGVHVYPLNGSSPNPGGGGRSAKKGKNMANRNNGRGGGGGGYDGLGIEPGLALVRVGRP